MSKFTPPEYHSTGFQCPYCDFYADQEWQTACCDDDDVYPIRVKKIQVEVSLCSHCENATLWLAEKIIYPPTRMSPPANSDLPDSVQEVYTEAADIASQSPRAACALLRLAIEKLLKHIGEKGNINEMIKNLVESGLDKRVQKALDIVRVTGNNAVHPGEIDFDDSTSVSSLFELINFIADELITRPKEIDEIFDRLPESAREGIKRRDGKTE
jgi:hypothetical protein